MRFHNAVYSAAIAWGVALALYWYATPATVSAAAYQPDWRKLERSAVESEKHLKSIRKNIAHLCRVETGASNSGCVR